MFLMYIMSLCSRLAGFLVYMYKYSMRIHKRVYAYSIHILSPRITNGAHLDTIWYNQFKNLLISEGFRRDMRHHTTAHTTALHATSEASPAKPCQRHSRFPRVPPWDSSLQGLYLWQPTQLRQKDTERQNQNISKPYQKLPCRPAKAFRWARKRAPQSQDGLAIVRCQWRNAFYLDSTCTYCHLSKFQTRSLHPAPLSWLRQPSHPDMLEMAPKIKQ